ncbi:hypothetical protein N7468_005471 [Penicillium chermesinum]|uniref:Luciferase domain-containing protein n=1 Tax=Penicillium chermesinum TaxID=63820 RepID=A0A9W9NZW4_9EURO|nr:uncharacterized protein N7468_005471 [Penicillium chermesinum]KAJ5232515.1 hypothetical protein N7468_005471 [Penicillium chermesinum]
MSYSYQVTKYLRTLRVPQSQNERYALALGATALLSSSLFFPAVYRDYKTFISYGPGGVPSNLFGWLLVRLAFQPFSREMLSTRVYDERVTAGEGHSSNNEGFLTLEPHQARDVEDRPVVGPHVVPQRQLSQVPDEAVMHVKNRRSVPLVRASKQPPREVPALMAEAHADGLFLADNIPASGIAKQMKGEIAHLHTGRRALCSYDPSPCRFLTGKKVIEAGWGQRHGFAGTSALKFLSFGTKPDIPAEFLLVYAPRDETEIETFMQIMAASVKFMTGREDVRLTI